MHRKKEPKFSVFANTTVMHVTEQYVVYFVIIAMGEKTQEKNATKVTGSFSLEFNLRERPRD